MATTNFVDNETIIDAEWLNDVNDLTYNLYSKGTWTPTIQDTSFSDSEGQVYGSQVGYYTRIGNMVLISGEIEITDLGTLTVGDQALIANLPIAASTAITTFAGGITVENASSLNITAGYSVTGHITNSSTFIGLLLWDSTSGTSLMSISELSVGARLGFHGMYIID